MLKLPNKLKRSALALSIAFIAAPAWAVPALQLDISGGTYSAATETIFASGNSFSVYAYGLVGTVPVADTYFLSVALMGAPPAGGSYGSFKVNGTTINATSDMIYGTPPLETLLSGPGGAIWDPGDLGKHSIFPTYFKEFGFKFSSANLSGAYNTQDFAGSGPTTLTTGTGMYFAKFDIDMGGLNVGQGLHFDLYSEKFNKKGFDTDINKFAPFSHDAEGHVVATPVPEPETYAMMLAGLGLMGLVARRRKQKAA